jgi:tetratricopeptide (TPR) repeat protein
VDVNCAAIPETLLEAELFGFERGAFTDARQAKAGLFQVAHRGTIFLDEVGLLPTSLQGKLLTVIEDRAVRRLGSTRSESVDVWILTATGEDLEAAMRARRVREDLYHRLAVLTLWLPPLRERGRDILLLAEHFLASACADYGLPPKSIGSDAGRALLAYHWPGNVRELANVVERVALLSDAPLITAEMLGLPEASRASPAPARAEPALPLEEAVGSAERAQLLEALRETSWNISRAAGLLGITRNTLRYRMEKHGLRAGATPTRPRRRVEPGIRAEGETPAAPRVPAPPGAVPPPIRIRWERQRLTLLRATLITPPAVDFPFDLSRAVELLREKVQSFGGRVEGLSPTGLVGVFGLEPLEDAPRRAANAALAIQKALERAWPGNGARVGVKVGIHVEQLLVGQTGGQAEIDLESKHQAWDVLEALVERAQPATILASEAAAPFLERRFDLIAVDAPEGGGRAYRLAGHERAGLELGGRLARFVGRTHELELLQDRLASAVRGQGQVVGIVGEAGIGKSRLLYEFRQSVGEERVTYLEGHCLSYGTAIPYLPVLEMLRSNCWITETDAPEAIEEKVHRGLESVGLDAREAAPYLLHFLGVKEGTEGLALLAAEVIQSRTFEILRQMSLNGSRQRPLILALEDAHWIDMASETYFASLVENLAGAPILLIQTYRPGYQPPWMQKSLATQIALPPLEPQDSQILLHSLLGDRVADSLAAVILSRAEGNPFFLEELAQAVREQGLPPTEAVPGTIDQVLRARIDRLPLDEKRLLQSAAVIGRNSPLSLVQAIADLPKDVLHRSLRHLATAEFLYEARRGHEPEYRFKHPLTHEVAYGSLLPGERRALHARIVEVIERLYPDRLAEHIERLAAHAYRGEVWEKALTYLRQAGGKAFGRAANLEAVALFEQALGALGHFPESRETLSYGIDLRFELRNALWALGKLARGLECLRKAQPLAEALGDERRLARLAAHTGSNYLVLGDNDRALEFSELALARAAALDDLELQVDTNQFRGVLHNSLGDYRRAIEFLERSIAALVGARGRGRFGEFYAVHGRTWLVWSLAELGEFQAATARAEEASRIAESSNHPHNVVAASWAAGYLACTKGEIATAIPVLERGFAMCRGANIAVWLRPSTALLGRAYALSGRLAAALTLLEQAVRQADENNVALAAWETYLGEAYMLAGRLDDALPPARHALSLAQERKEKGFQAHVLRLSAEIATRGNRVNEAEDFCLRAVALAEELGMRPLAAHCHFELGTLYRKAGQPQRAEAHFLTAGTLFRQLNMRPGPWGGTPASPGQSAR